MLLCQHENDLKIHYQHVHIVDANKIYWSSRLSTDNKIG